MRTAGCLLAVASLRAFVYAGGADANSQLLDNFEFCTLFFFFAVVALSNSTRLVKFALCSSIYEFHERSATDCEAVERFVVECNDDVVGCSQTACLCSWWCATMLIFVRCVYFQTN